MTLSELLAREPAANTNDASRAARTIDARFADFDRDNPEVWSAFARHALRLIERGRRHFSADAILHVIRFDRAIATRGEDDFKINNDYSSRYARKFAERYPQHGEFFEQRKLSA